jgi:hypothetical protein
MSQLSRRKFMKGALVTGAVTGFPYFFSCKPKAALEPGERIHPHIHDLRVVGITDPAMSRQEPGPDWAARDKLVNPEVVKANIEKMALKLAQTSDVKQAWQTIFVKPPKKNWSEAVVAIKTNQIAQQHTTSAVMSSICHALTDVIGIKATNIHIYDATHGKNMDQKTPFEGLPEGVALEGQWGGFNVPISIPGPYKEGMEKAVCLDHLTNGTVDILVNIALCKGHNQKYGRFTMAMKNHMGTFDPKPIHREQGLEYLIGVNKTPEILGPVDVKSGRVVFPRQQLCLIDALWASDPGPGGEPTAQPNFLAMGVTAVGLDYLIASKFRKEAMGWNINGTVAERFLTEFGYTLANLPDEGNIIPA